MRFHVLGIPHTVSSKEYVACAYTQKIVKFCKMMHARGHEIIHYGHEDSKVDCTEHVSVLTNEDFVKTYGSHDWRKNFFKFDMSDHAYQTFFKNAIREVGLRKKQNDFILPFWGAGVKPICDAHPDLITVEPGIGYAGGHWARFKIFESYAIYHAYYGLSSVGTCKQDWYDVVIPNYFDLDEFEYCDKKEDYFLFLGRVYEGKGIHVAIQVTAALGAKLKVAGQNNLYDCGYKEIPSHVEFVGYADVDKRKELMSKAKGAFVASLYNEPFGGVQVECLLSGTPTITTDWGAFTENNIHGLTGYRCRCFNDFLWAAKNIHKINPKNCREFGENFSLDKVAVLYEKYFTDVLNVYTGNGWYQQYEFDVGSIKKHIPSNPERCNYDAIISEETPQADSLASWIQSKKFNKVNDYGCGPGIYVNSMRKLGIDAYGYDIDSRIPNDSHFFKKNILDDDFNDKCNAAVCLEVLEHIEEADSIRFMQKMLSSIEDDGYLIFSAAVPNQGGDGHINCKPKQFWEDKIVNSGFVRVVAEEKEVLDIVKSNQYMGWFANNFMLFKKIVRINK